MLTEETAVGLRPEGSRVARLGSNPPRRTRRVAHRRRTATMWHGDEDRRGPLSFFGGAPLVFLPPHPHPCHNDDTAFSSCTVIPRHPLADQPIDLSRLPARAPRRSPQGNPPPPFSSPLADPRNSSYFSKACPRIPPKPLSSVPWPGNSSSVYTSSPLPPPPTSILSSLPRRTTTSRVESRVWHSVRSGTIRLGLSRRMMISCRKWGRSV
jgi:hypothetical protein